MEQSIKAAIDGTYTNGMGGGGTWRLSNNDDDFYMDVDGSTWTIIGRRTMPGCYEGAFGLNVPGGPSGIWQGCFR